MAAVGGGRTMPGHTRDVKDSLPTFIYDYFIKKGKPDLARAIYEGDLGVKVKPRGKASPPGREVNGIDDPASMDAKDQLPQADIVEQLPDASFLQEWWWAFWDLWNASKKGGSGPSAHYIRLAENQRAQKERILQMANAQNMNPMNPNLRGMMSNGMVNGMPGGINQGDMRRGAIANNRNMMHPQMRNMPGQQQMGQASIQREGSDIDRPQSPTSGDNAPSPKRQRTDGGPMGNQVTRGPVPNGAGQTPNMMQNGGAFDPTSMPGGPLNGLPGGPGQKQMQQQLAGRFAGGMNLGGEAMLARGINTPGGMNSSPMIAPGGGEFPMNMFDQQGGVLGARGMSNNPNPQGGALADYQMQLMLLEQQNKKRLLMARQEQEVPPQGPGGVPAIGGQAMMGAQGFPQASVMSPHGSRNGHSPSPNDQMKRGTPNMPQASPRPDGTGSVTRGSPAPNNMDPSHIGPNMTPNQFYMNRMGADGMMAPNGARGPAPGFNAPNGMNSAQHMEMLRRQGQMAGGTWPSQGPQIPGQAMQQIPQQGQNDNQPRGNMPPPQVPPGGPNAGRTNPSSPAPTQAPPTPSQNKNANAKTKKDSKDNKKKLQQKKNTTGPGATPSSEADHPPTPTPKTPTSPNPPPVNWKPPVPAQANQPQPQPPNGPQAQPNGPPAPPGVPNPPESNSGPGQPFGSLDPSGADMGGDFALGDFHNPMETNDVLEGFDFDTFLHNMDGPNPDFEFSLAGMGGMGDVEMGANEG